MTIVGSIDYSSSAEYQAKKDPLGMNQETMSEGELEESIIDWDWQRWSLIEDTGEKNML